MPYNHLAVFRAYPNVQVYDDGDGARDENGNRVELDPDLIAAATVEIEQEFSNTEYQRKREREYPSLATFADAYYWAQKGDNTKMDEYVAACDAVKVKYPKPS